MKKSVLLISVVVALSVTVGAADYKEVMKASVSKMVQATTADELTDLANQFVRISDAEKKEWLPGYYAAYSYVIIVSQMNPDKAMVLKYLDMAQANIDKIMPRIQNESEIYALQSMVYMLRIIEPNDGITYSSLTNEALAAAEVLNPGNPRVFYLRGLMAFHTPEAYGGGVSKAKPLFEKAIKMFESTQPKELYPSWGKEHCVMMLEQTKTSGK
jgi:hypothetical protein